MMASVFDLLDRIQDALDLSRESFCDILELKREEYEGYRLEPELFPMKSLFKLVDFTGLTLENIVEGDIDFISLRKKFGLGETELPGKYRVGALSKRRTLINFFDYIENRLGWRYKRLIQRRFQVEDEMFLDQDLPINLRLAVDICNWLSQYGSHSTEWLFGIGEHSAYVNRGSLMATELRAARNLADAYEVMIDDILGKYIEKNFSWRVQKLSKSSCVIQGTPNSDLGKLLGKNYMNSSRLAVMRNGFAASIPHYFGLDSSKVETLSCVSQGDRETKVKFTFPRQPMRPLGELSLARFE